MIPQILDRFEKNIGLLPDCIEGIVIEERNGMCELEITYPIFSDNWAHLIRGNIVVADTNETLVNQMFRIYKISKPLSGKIKVYARHIFFDLARDLIEEFSLANASCEYALNELFRRSQFSQGFTGYSDIINAQDYKMSTINLIKAIGGTQGSILDTYGTGAEILRDNKKVYIKNRRGHDNGVTIEYSKNMTGLNIEFDDSKLITRIKAVAKYTDENNNEVVVYSNPKYVDSTLISTYETPFISEIDFSNKFKEKEIPTSSKLTLLAEKYFIENKCDQVKTNIKVEFIPLSKCVGYENIQDKISLCDTVTIKDFRYKLDTQAKVIKTHYNFLSDRYEKIELGEPKTSLGDLVDGGGQVGPPGPPGQNGKPGQDGKPGEEFPDTLPKIPVLEGKVLGFASVDLNWSFENKVYYSYQLFGNKTGEIPNMFDLIYEGQASAFLHQVKPNETWYYWVRGLNSYGKATELSEKLTITTTKVDDFEAYFSSLAVEKLVAGIFTADYMEAGIIKGHWIDAKNLSVTDGNGKRTLDIDSFGNVNLDVASFKVRNEQVYTNVETTEKINTAISNYKKVVDIEFEEVTKAYNDLTTEMNTSFKDGIIDEAEARAINERLVALEKEKEDIYKEYNTIYSNSNLNNTSEKTELLNSKSSLDIAYLELKNTILSAIEDNKIIASEIENINSKTDIYNKASATYREKFTQAIDKIGSVKVNVVNSKTETLKENFTEFKQSSEDVQIKIEKRGTANLLKSSNGLKAYHSGEWILRKWNTNLAPQISYLTYNEAWAYPDPKINTFQLSIQDGWGMWGGDVGIIQNNVKVVKGETYTMSAYVAGHRHNDCYMYIRGAAENDYELVGSLAFTPPSGGVDANNWSLVHTTFTAQRDYCHIEFGMRNSGAENPYLWFAKPMLNKGTIPAEYTDSQNELHSGITKIDGDGVRCDFENNTRAEMGRNGFYYKTSDGQWEYHALSLVGEARIPSEGTRYIYLPEVFRGKNIRVVCQVGQIGNGTDAINNPKPLISFWAGADDLQNNPSGYAPYFRLYGSTRLRNDDGSIAYRDKEVLITYTVLA